MKAEYRVFEDLCKTFGVTPYKVAKSTGVATATLTNWKQGKYSPKIEKVALIADFFNVDKSVFY